MSKEKKFETAVAKAKKILEQRKKQQEEALKLFKKITSNQIKIK